MPSKGRMFAGCTVALVTPFRDGEVDYEALQALGGLADRAGDAGRSARSGRRASRRRSRTTSTSGSSPPWSSAPPGRAKVLAGTGSNATAEAVRLTQVRRQGRGRRRPAGLPLLQPADPGRALRPLRPDRRERRPSPGPLQRPGPDRAERRARDGRAAGQARADRRGQGGERLARPGQRHPRADRPDGPLGRRQPDAADAGRRGRGGRLGRRQPGPPGRDRPDRRLPARRPGRGTPASTPSSSRSAATCSAWPPTRSRSRRPWRCSAAATARCGCPSVPPTSKAREALRRALARYGLLARDE